MSNIYTEAELVHLLRSHSREGFDYLYANYSATLFAVIHNIAGDREVACDIMQETFVKIWRHIDTYDPTKGRLYTWMHNLAKNVSIDYVRGKSHKNAGLTIDLSEGHSYIPAKTVLNVDTIGLAKSVNRMDAKYSLLVQLVYFQGYTMKEVSECLDIPIGTIKSRLRKAVSALREEYA